MAALKEPELDEILAFCAEDPIERVFLEDIARRGLGRFTALAQRGRVTALCHAGANLVPSRQGCAAFAELAEAAQARMIIGEQGAVSDLWTAASPILPSPRADRPDQPVYVLDEAPEPGETGLRPAEPDDFELLLPACAAAHREEIGIDPLERDPKGSAGGRAPRSTRGAPGSGPTAGQSCSRPKRRPGRRARCSCSRCGSTRRRG